MTKFQLCLRIFWYIFIIITLLIFLLHSSHLLLQLLEGRIGYETNPDTLDFRQPDIVICPYDAYAIEFLKHPPPDEYEFMQNVSHNIHQIVNTLKKHKGKKVKSNINSFLWDSINLHDFVKAFYYRNISNIFQKFCPNKNLNDSKLELNYDHFICYRVTPNDCKITGRKPIGGTFYMHSYYPVKRNLTNAIDLKWEDYFQRQLLVSSTIDTNVDDLLYIYFAESQRYIRAFDIKSLSIGGYQTNAYLKTIEYEKYNRTQLPCSNRSYGTFYNLLEKNITNNLYNFSIDGTCKYTILQKLLYKNYGCVHTRYPISTEINSNFKHCFHIDILKKGYKYLLKLISSIKSYKFIARKRCRKLRICKTHKYSMTLTKFYYPRTTTLRELAYNYNFTNFTRTHNPGLYEAYSDIKMNPDNIIYWRKNFFSFKIYAGEDHSTLIREYKSYNLINFFSDVGGILGFYLGASFLTIKELIELCCLTLQKKRSKKSSKDILMNPENGEELDNLKQ